MKYLLQALFICLLFVCCKSQRVNGVHLSKTTRENLAMVRKEARREIDISCDPNKRMTVYADSLNNLTEESPLPAFLFYRCFDWSERLCWPGIHNPISLRQIIASKVTNRAVVERILNNEDSCLRQICTDRDLSVPEAEKSFYELFRLRYAELK